MGAVHVRTPKNFVLEERLERYADAIETNPEAYAGDWRKACAPAGRMRPSACSFSNLAMLTALQIEPVLRGVKRMEYDSSSMRLRTPSIQPKHRASSTESGQFMLGWPLPTLR